MFVRHVSIPHGQFPALLALGFQAYCLENQVLNTSLSYTFIYRGIYILIAQTVNGILYMWTCLEMTDGIKFKSFKVDWCLLILIIGISEASLRRLTLSVIFKWLVKFVMFCSSEHLISSKREAGLLPDIFHGKISVILLSFGILSDSG